MQTQPELNSSIPTTAPSGYHGAGVAKHPFEPQPEPAATVRAEPERDFRWVLAALAASLLAGGVLAFAWHRRPGQDVQPKEQTTIQYEPLESTGGQAAAGGEEKYRRALDRLRIWRNRRK